MFKHNIIIKLFLYIQSIFYWIYNKIFIFNNLIIFKYNNNNNNISKINVFKYKILFNLYYHFGIIFDINKNNNFKWICYLNINEKIFIYEINNYCINVFNHLLKLYNTDEDKNNITNIMLFKINDNIINISKYTKNTKINDIINYELFIDKKLNNKELIINYISLNSMIPINYNYNEIKNKIIGDL